MVSEYLKRPIRALCTKCKERPAEPTDGMCLGCRFLIDNGFEAGKIHYHRCGNCGAWAHGIDGKWQCSGCSHAWDDAEVVCFVCERPLNDHTDRQPCRLGAVLAGLGA